MDDRRVDQRGQLVRHAAGAGELRERRTMASIRGSESAVGGNRMAAAPCTLSSWLAQGLTRKAGTFPILDGRSVMAETEKRIDTLADRAREAAARVHASTSETKEKLESQVSEVRAAADKTRRELDARSADARDEGSRRWTEIRQEWHDHIAEIQRKVDAQKQAFSVDRAERRAARAEDDALAAIDFAYLAIEDAEWAVLDAVLARAEADELAAIHA
jgi:hypothetical protein